MKNITKIVTLFVIPLFFIAILGYDVYAIYKGGTEASISAFIIQTAYKMPFGVYMVGLTNGILIGHLFWRMKSNEMTKDIDNQNK